MTRHLTLLTLATCLAVLGEARAAIVYFPGEDIAIPNTYAGVSVDLETGDSSTSLNGLPTPFSLPPVRPPALSTAFTQKANS